MQAIHIKQINPTASKGLRYKATAMGESVLVSNQYELNELANASFVAQQLLDIINSLQSKHKLTERFKLGPVAQLPDNTYCAIITRVIS